MIQKSFLVFISLIVLSTFSMAKDHPTLLISKMEAVEIKNNLSKYPLLNITFEKTKTQVDSAITKPVIVPPPGEGGGYEHEKHKQNYRDMQAAGILYTITGDEKYAQFVKDMLLSYSEMYPKLGAHPLAHNQAPGKLFHQLLNENVWLVYTAQAYDCIYDWLSEDDRNIIEMNLFNPIIQWFTVENAHQLDRIHNHGTWAVASIGMLGYVLGRQDLVDKAIYGTKKDGTGGFLKQLDLLFSPDGYYMEGPYYIRYALRPFYLFAEAIERNQPELKIFDYRDKILKKVYYATVQTSFPDGVFPPINDASRSMSVRDIGAVVANGIVYERYGTDTNLLGVALLQNQVNLSRNGLKLAKDFGDGSSIKIPKWGSVELTDGHDGTKGGLGILRTGEDMDQSMLLMKYGVLGGGHGHLDKLNFVFYDQGRSVIPDYGFARWINIEPKFGGRYLPENNSYAKQTVAHNTVVVDKKSQKKGNKRSDDEAYAERHFFNSVNPNIQVVSAIADNQYSDVNMQRTMFLINDKRLVHPVLVDLYRLSSKENHQYDYVIHHNGQMITSNAEYSTNTSKLNTLGDDQGYQHIWQTATANIDDMFSYTWLDGQRYYTITTTTGSHVDIIFGRTGANDPQFNLRSEPLLIVRKEASDLLFASVIEPHGYFNEEQEQSRDARGLITNIRIIGHNDQGSIIEVEGKNDLKWEIMVSNTTGNEIKKNEVKFSNKLYKWTGNFEFLGIRQ